MSTTFIDKDKIQQLQQKLETNKDMSNESQIGIIENTSKELFDLFKEPENVADYSMKEDIKKIGKILEERKDVLESRETIPEKKMNGRYGELFSPI